MIGQAGQDQQNGLGERPAFWTRLRYDMSHNYMLSQYGSPVKPARSCDRLWNMTRFHCALSLALLAPPLFAALPGAPAPDQAALIKSKDPKLAANKKIAKDFFRVVLRGRHLDEAEKYMKDDYIQHNPNADTGIVGFKAYFI